jgi:hypothetical protein
MNDPVEVQKLSKGLHEFHIAPGQRGSSLPANYLQDYLDAFIEEAYEHEYGESKTRAPRLEGGDPYMFLARCVYNELLCFAVHNRNLLRAIKKFKIQHPKYILDRLNALGLCRVNSENYAAERSGQVGGYHPEKVEPLAQTSPNGSYGKSDSAANAFGAIEGDRFEKARQGNMTIADGPEMVQLSDHDAVDPFAALKKSIDARPDGLGRIFAVDQGEVKPTIDGKCPIHGFGDLTKSMNLENYYVSCSCPTEG